MSLAGRFNAIVKSFSNNASDIPPGMYEAVISEAVLQEPDTKGQSVRLKFELCSPDFEGQNVLTNWFRIFDVEGEPFAGGIKSLAYNLARLGVGFDFDGLTTKEEVEEHIGEVLAGITEEKPGIIAKVVNNPGNDGRIFTNVSVEKPCDNDLVQEYKDNVPY